MTKNGVISTFAGSPNPTTGDGAPAITGSVTSPTTLVVGSDGTVYVATFDTVESITPDGLLHVLAGSVEGFPPAEGVLATQAILYPQDVGFDSQGNMLVFSGTVVWQIGSDGKLHHLADLDLGSGILLLPDGTILHSDAWVGQYRKYTAVPAASGQTTSPYTVVAGVAGHQSFGNNVPGTQASISVPQGLAVDGAGNLYITEITSYIHKLSTGGILTTIAGSATATYATPDGTQALATAIRDPTAVAVDQSGNIYYAEPYAYHVRKISTNGTVSTYAGNGQAPDQYEGSFDTRDGSPAISAALRPDSLAVDAQGNLYIFDSASLVIWRVSTDGILHLAVANLSDSFHPLAADPSGTVFYLDNDFDIPDNLMEFSGGATPQLIRDISAYFYAAFPAPAFAIDGGGNLYVGGESSTNIRKAPADGSIAYMINSADPPPLASYTGFALDKSGNLWAGDQSTGRIIEVPSATSCTPSLFPVIANNGVVNAASYQKFLPAPGEIVAVFGFLVGPSQGVSTTVDANGQVATNLGNTQLYIDGEPAPLLFASSGQLVSVIPYTAGIPDLSTQPNVWAGAQVVVNGFMSNQMYFQIGQAQPGIFTQNASGSGPAAALNQDYSVNSPANPAAKGSAVMVYATGLGALNPSPVDGFLTGSTLGYVVAPVTAFLNGEPATVLYAGSAPGLIAGANQINIQIPADAPSGDLDLTISQLGTLGPQAHVTISVQ